MNRVIPIDELHRQMVERIYMLIDNRSQFQGRHLAECHNVVTASSTDAPLVTLAATVDLTDIVAYVVTTVDLTLH